MNRTARYRNIDVLTKKVVFFLPFLPFVKTSIFRYLAVRFIYYTLVVIWSLGYTLKHLINDLFTIRASRALKKKKNPGLHCVWRVADVFGVADVFAVLTHHCWGFSLTHHTHGGASAPAPQNPDG
jgi:hypothetical protein